MNDVETIKRNLDTGVFDSLVGCVEDDQVEFKLTPYQFATPSQKQEFAKDLSGLANANGGLIILGVKTTKDPQVLGDVAKGVEPFSQALF